DAATALQDHPAVVPFYEDSRVTLYQGDAVTTLRDIADESVHCVVTSPPYVRLTRRCRPAEASEERAWRSADEGQQQDHHGDDVRHLLEKRSGEVHLRLPGRSQESAEVHADHPSKDRQAERPQDTHHKLVHVKGTPERG